LIWYINPIYPALAALTGWLTLRILKDPNFKQAGKNILLLLLAVALIRSESELLKFIHHHDPSYSQLLLDELAKMKVPPHTPVFMRDWRQGDRFVAEVEYGLNPTTCGKPEESLGTGGYLMLEKDPKNENQTFVRDHHLNVCLQNEGWMMVKL
jgi:hypothetical protein